MKKPLYTQISKNDINKIIKIKDTFPKLSTNKVSKIQKVMNNVSKKNKLKLNITTKSSSRKQVIVFIGSNNSERVMNKTNAYISNINRLLKGIKSDISANFICTDNKDLLIITNKVAAISDLKIIEKYIKNFNNIDYSNIISPKLFQSKFYLKILSILYFVKNTNLLIFSNIIESVIKLTHIFNNITLTFYFYIIKVSPKSDVTVIWVNIWDFQNGLNCYGVLVH